MSQPYSVPQPPQFNNSPGHVQSNMDAIVHNTPHEQPLMIFTTAKAWNIVFGVFVAVVMLGTLFLLTQSLMAPYWLAGVVFLGQLIIFGAVFYYVNRRTLLLEKHFIQYKVGRSTTILPYKNIRSYTVQNGILWGGVYINGGDRFSRVNFWALGNHETAIDLVKQQADKHMLE